MVNQKDVVYIPGFVQTKIISLLWREHFMVGNSILGVDFPVLSLFRPVLNELYIFYAMFRNYNLIINLCAYLICLKY